MRSYLWYAFSIIMVGSIFSGCIPVTSTSQIDINFYSLKYKPFLEKDKSTNLLTASTNTTLEFNQTSKTYIFKQYQPQKEVLLNYTEYKDELLKNKQGKHILYGDDGRILQEGQYVNNKKIGFWQDFYQKGNYVNGKKDGTWYIFNIDSLGNLTDTISKIIYKNGVYVTSRLLDAFKLTSYPYLPICEEKGIRERKKCTEDNLLKEMYSKISYPSFARKNGIQGLTFSSFIIDKNGEVQDIKVLRTVCNQMETEVIKTIKLLPKLEPGMFKDKKIDVRFNLPIRFRLQ